ncbi:MAG: MFS transporter [Gammaproteobacteria bacterium]
MQISTGRPPVAPAAPVPFGTRFGWGIGSLGVSLLFNTYSALLLFYLTNVVGLKLEVAGTLIVIAKIYDALINVPMGVLSDNTKSRWGRRRPWFLLGAVLCSTWFLVIFNTPAVGASGASPALMAWVLGALLLYSTGYAIFNVPYLAMPAEMTSNYHERTAIMSWRVIFIQVGNFIAVGLGPRLAQEFGGGLDGYSLVGSVLALCTLVTMVACFFGTANARQVQQTAVRYPAMDQLRSALKNRPFLQLAVFKFLILVAGATVFATLLFFVKNVLKLDQGVMLWYTAAHGIAAFITVPLIWVPLSARFGKRNALLVATLGFMFTALTWLLAGPGESVMFFVIRAFLLGSFAAGKLLLGLTMLPDIMEYDYLKTGLRREGTYAGAYNVVEKAAYAISPLMMTVVLGVLGYQESVNNAAVAQSDSALLGIYLSIAILPALCNLAAAFVMLRYDLTEQKLKDLRAGAASAATGRDRA